MSKLYVSSKPSTAVDRIREALDQAESTIGDESDTGPHTLDVLYLFDQIAEELRTLEQLDVDVRAERTRFEIVQRRLKRRSRQFLNQAGRALVNEREELKPTRSRWWWYLDEVAKRRRRRKLLQIGGAAAAVIVVLGAAWLAYQQFLAPPPELSMAYQRIQRGTSHVEEGNLRAALSDFGSATSLTPEDPEPWLWKGVLHDQLRERVEAEQAFARAESLYGTTFDFVLNRGRVYLQAGNVEKARADARAAIDCNATSGWGYYLRAGVAVRQGDYDAAVADLQRAAELGSERGDARLQTMASTQLAQLVQIQPGRASE